MLEYGHFLKQVFKRAFQSKNENVIAYRPDTKSARLKLQSLKVHTSNFVPTTYITDIHLQFMQVEL